MDLAVVASAARNISSKSLRFVVFPQNIFPGIFCTFSARQIDFNVARIKPDHSKLVFGVAGNGFNAFSLGSSMVKTFL